MVAARLVNSKRTRLGAVCTEIFLQTCSETSLLEEWFVILKFLEVISCVYSKCRYVDIDSGV